MFMFMFMSIGNFYVQLCALCNNKQSLESGFNVVKSSPESDICLFKIKTSTPCRLHVRDS